MFCVAVTILQDLLLLRRYVGPRLGGSEHSEFLNTGAGQKKSDFSDLSENCAQVFGDRLLSWRLGVPGASPGLL